MNEVDLGKRLQNARKAASLTQQELCHEAGMSYSTLAKIERGAIKSPSIFTIQRIAGVLDVPLDALVGANPNKTGNQSKKRSKSGISFVYFDINGCLVRFFHRAFTEIAKNTGVSADIIETAFWHYNDDINRGEITLDEFNLVLADKLKLKTIDWKSYYMAAVDPISEMQDLVKWAAGHYQVGLLSNIMPGFIETMLEKKLIPNVAYQAVIDSSVVHAIKPEEQIYEIAQAKAGVESSEILLIDDSRTNLMAAERMGWKVLWFDDYNPDQSVERVKDALELA